MAEGNVRGTINWALSVCLRILWTRGLLPVLLTSSTTSVTVGRLEASNFEAGSQRKKTPEKPDAFHCAVAIIAARVALEFIAESGVVHHGLLASKIGKEGVKETRGDPVLGRSER